MEQVKIVLTEKDYRKLWSLSLPANITALDVIRGKVDQNTASMARHASLEERQNMDWLGIVAGLPEEADEIATEANVRMAAVELEAWLNDGGMK